MSTPTKTIILITGANSGVGFAAATVLARASPMYHVIVSSRNLANAETAVAAIAADRDVQGTVSALQLDVTSVASIAAAAQSVEARFGHVDVLVNNAGVASRDPDTQKQLSETLAANAVGPALVAEAFNPLLLKAPGEKYSVFVSSGLGSLGMASDFENPSSVYDGDAYRMSKAALNMLVIQQWKRFGRENGVKVFAFCPGLVESNLRGTSEEARKAKAYGGAKDPETSGKALLSIIRGERDEDVGSFVHGAGVYPW